MLKPEYREILTELSLGNVYLAGGFVRDLLMDREGKDIDLTVVGDACQVARQFPDPPTENAPSTNASVQPPS